MATRTVAGRPAGRAATTLISHHRDGAGGSAGVGCRDWRGSSRQRRQMDPRHAQGNRPGGAKSRPPNEAPAIALPMRRHAGCWQGRATGRERGPRAHAARSAAWASRGRRVCTAGPPQPRPGRPERAARHMQGAQALVCTQPPAERAVFNNAPRRDNSRPGKRPSMQPRATISACGARQPSSPSHHAPRRPHGTPRTGTRLSCGCCPSPTRRRRGTRGPLEPQPRPSSSSSAWGSSSAPGTCRVHCKCIRGGPPASHGAMGTTRPAPGTWPGCCRGWPGR
jgi:hypothetical protein